MIQRTDVAVFPSCNDADTQGDNGRNPSKFPCTVNIGDSDTRCSTVHCVLNTRCRSDLGPVPHRRQGRTAFADPIEGHGEAGEVLTGLEV